MENCRRFLLHLASGFIKNERKTIRFTLHHVFFINLAVIVILLTIVTNDVHKLPGQTFFKHYPQQAFARAHIFTPPVTQITISPKILFIPKPTVIPSLAPTTTNHQVLPTTQQVFTQATPTSLPTQVKSQPATQSTSTDAVHYVLNLINNERAKNGAAPVNLDDTLSGCATTHSKQMADRNGLFHDLQNDVCDQSHTKGENVGTASTQPNTSIDTIHTMMVAEKPSGHWAIMVDPRFVHVGLGVVVTGTGTWLTEDFGGNY